MQIAQEIQEGIEQYKKQQNARARELDKKLKKANQQVTPPDAREVKPEPTLEDLSAATIERKG